MDLGSYFVKEFGRTCRFIKPSIPNLITNYVCHKLHSKLQYRSYTEFCLAYFVTIARNSTLIQNIIYCCFKDMLKKE